MRTLEWDKGKIKKGKLPVDGVFTHFIGGEVRVVVIPKERTVKIITVNGSNWDSITYSEEGGAMTLTRLKQILIVAGLS